MKRRTIVLALALTLLTLVVGTGVVLAGGPKNRKFVVFETLKMSTAGDEVPEYVYCEGYFMETGNGIVHEWRNNPECVPYAPQIPSASLHLVFKPAEKFSSPDCDDGSIVYWSGLWTLNPNPDLPDYKDVLLAHDDADLEEVLGEPNVDFWQVCIYAW